VSSVTFLYDDVRNTKLGVCQWPLPPNPPTQAPPEYARAAELREALRRFQRRSDELTSSNGLTTRTFQLLLMIKTARSDNGRVEPTELEQRLQLGKSTVTELRSTKREAWPRSP
jgi:hypothetical protein